MWVSPIQSVESRNRTKRLTDPPMSKGEFLFAWLPWAGTLVFPCLWTRNETSAFPGSQACQSLNWNYTFSSPGSPAYRLTLPILELVGLHNHMSQFLIINLYIFFSSILLILFLANPNTIPKDIFNSNLCQMIIQSRLEYLSETRTWCLTRQLMLL